MLNGFKDFAIPAATLPLGTDRAETQFRFLPAIRSFLGVRAAAGIQVG
jgi:hypothetical protein